ncbi:PEGA domain-containing protein [Candidatus Nomurabacteria bacterium]|nr:PEGA domain-containing protein [Candidatus Nomurabacteria bacterium]
MYKQKSRKSHISQRIIIGILMTSFVVFSSTILLLLMLGYRLSYEGKGIEQGGLVQFRSTPSGANVTAGSAKLTDKTPSKITLLPGSYDIRMQRSGYKTWQKQAVVKSGAVLWLNSARLIPEKIQTDQVSHIGSLSDVSFSADRKTAAILTGSSSPIIKLVDIGGETVTMRDITVPEKSYLEARRHKFSIEGWVSDTKRIIVKHLADKRTEWLVVDPKDNTATVLAVPSPDDGDIKDLVSDPASANRVYVHTDTGGVYRYDLGTKKMSPIILSDVDNMSFVKKDVIAYSTAVNDGISKVGYLSLGAKTSRALASLEVRSAPLVEGHEYYGEYYITIASEKGVSIQKYDNLTSSDSESSLTSIKHINFPIRSKPSFVSQQAGGRFVVVQLDSSQVIYDLELNQSTDVPIVGAKDRIEDEISWLDGYNFMTSLDGMLRMYEYDGSNIHQIVKSAPGYGAVLSPSGKYLYSIGNSANGYVLQRSRMIIN